MKTIRELFDPSKPIDRRIEKVITYESTNEDLLKQEILEYVATDSIEQHMERLLDLLEEGMSGGNSEIGVWVSGFYGSGKSSFTKYLGFALDPERKLDGKPFLNWLQDQCKSGTLRTRIATVAKKFPAAVVMLDLASEQLAGATLAEISSVLYAKVMQWAGYSRDRKVAYLELMLERDNRMDEFEKRITEITKGKTWESIKNQPLAVKSIASKIAAEFYPELWEDSKSFNEIKIEDAIKEDDRVREMLDLVRRRSGKENIIFILDEVGQYVAARDDLILNLQGLAENLRKIGRGKAWILATAQQTLTEDDPRAAMNTAKLFKLKDRFPISIDLEASDIQEITHSRLLGKSKAGEEKLETLFDNHGPQFRYSTELKNTKYYRSDIDKNTFVKLYPFLPQHFDILLQLLARLAKTRGGVGLRSAIKVVQDVLVDQGKVRRGATLLADEQVGALTTTVILFDTLVSDIERPFPHIVNGVRKVETIFGRDSVELQAAKSVAVLQILEDFPVSRENVSALMHPNVSSPSMLDKVNASVDTMLAEESIPLNEVDGSLRFMSEAVLDLDKERQKIMPRTVDTRQILSTALKELFSPPPSTRLEGGKNVATGLKLQVGSIQPSLLGEKEEIQTVIEFISPAEYERIKKERIIETQQRSNRNNIFFLGQEDPEIDDLLVEVYRCKGIYIQYRNKTVDKEVEEYLRAQKQRADGLSGEISRRLSKSLLNGSFLFRGRPNAVSEFGGKLLEATKKFLDTVAEDVFEKYKEASVQADSGVAERFLKIERLDLIPTKDDPLSFVQKSGGGSVIDTNHKAVISVKDYLEKQGQVDGRRLMDDFYRAPYGWSKDTTRYIISAMLVGSVIKLRVSGEDITVRGEVAVNSLKNTNSFNKIGVSLRDSAPPLEALGRARERLLELTAEDVLPLEEEISKCVIKHFPDFQQNYAPLATQLQNLELKGVDRAQSVQDNLAEILKGDASDAANRLGGEECPLFDDLCWAKDVRKAFDNGIGEKLKKAKILLTEIPELPNIDVPGELIADTAGIRDELSGNIDRDDFYKSQTQIQQKISEIESKISAKAAIFKDRQQKELESEKKRLMSLHEWNLLGEEDKNRLGAELEKLEVAASNDLGGIKKLIKDQYVISAELKRIEQEIYDLAEPPPPPPPEPDEEEKILVLPSQRPSPEELMSFIKQLEEARSELEKGQKIKIIWQR